MTDPPRASGDPMDLRRILDTVSDAFLRVDRSWRVTYINQGGREMLERIGLDPDRILGGDLWDEVPSDRAGPGGRALERAMERGTVESEETYYAPLDLWFEVTAFPYRDGEGLLVLLTDITGELETARALRDVEGRYRAMVEHAPHGMIVLDVESDSVVDFNQKVLEILGRTEEEMAGSIPYQFSPERQPDGRRSVDAAQAYLQQALDGHVPVFDWIHLRGDGQEVATEIRLSRVPPEEANLVQASILDITERRRAEQALRQSEEMYRALFEQDVAGNFVSSADGTLLACNRAFADIFGLSSPEEAVGRDMTDVYFSVRDRRDLLSKIRSEGSIDYYEIEARRTDGTPLHLAVNVRGVFDDDGKLVELRGHVVDTTERHRLEEQLQRAQRMESIGRLAGGIAHDFNNLLTTVTGHTDLVLSDPRLPGDLRDDLGKIKKAASRAARLTNQLVAFSRRDVYEVSAVDVNQVVDDVVDMLDRVIGEDIRLDIQLEEGLWDVPTDPTRMEQVLMNLAVNARDALSRGGDLGIRTRNVEISGDGGGPAELDPGRYVVLEVEDSGEGIPDDRLARIFEPFYTTKGPGEGSGLGLAMVYGIVRRTGGHVQVESTLGRGTTFSVFLPAGEPSSSDDRSPWRGQGTEESGVAARGMSGARDLAGGPGPVGATGDAGESTILLLQHDPAVRKAVRQVLHRGGFSVLEADDPTEAAAFCREWQSSIEAVVSDTLNDEDEDLLRSALGRHRPSVPTLWTWDRETEATPALGPHDGLLRKPFSTHELSRRLAEVLAGASPGTAAPDTDLKEGR